MSSEHKPKNIDAELTRIKGEQELQAEQKFVQIMREELVKPANITAELQSLFEQYALIGEDSEWLFTPDVYIQGAKERENNLYICHLYEQGVFAVMNRLPEDSMNISVPMYSFANGESPAILNRNSEVISEDSEVLQARQIVEFLKHGYRRMVRDNADLINLTKYLQVGSNEVVLDAVMLFYFKGDNPKANYLPITVDIAHPSDALDTAVSGFYETYGEMPTPQKPSPIRFEGVEVEINGNPRPIEKVDMPYFSGLFRELTTFDSDRDLGMRVLAHCQADPKLN